MAGENKKITRKEFVKKAAMTAAAVGAAAVGSVAKAKNYAMRGGGRPSDPIVGSGDVEKDYAALQSAISSGGNVYIAGKFQLGSRTIYSDKDVNIIGADGASLVGGFDTITQSGGQMSVTSVIFEAPSDAAILILGSEKTVISDCTVSGLQAIDQGAPWNSAIALPYTNSGADPALIEIVGNNLDVSSPPSRFPFPTACIFAWYSNANLTVRSNNMAGGQYASVFLVANAGTSDITKNRMAPDPPYYSGFGGAGAWIIGWDVFGPCSITDNDINCPPDNSFAFGYGDFVCAGPVVVFRNNKVNLPRCFFSAIALHGAVCNASITNNQIKGASESILTFFDSGLFCDGARNNLFKGNSFAPADVGSGVDIVLGPGANDNTIAGYSGSVYNDQSNTGNVITGFNMKSALPAQLGQRISEANSKMKELKKLLAR